jgi:hypothetical protein
MLSDDLAGRKEVGGKRCQECSDENLSSPENHDVVGEDSQVDLRDRDQ